MSWRSARLQLLSVALAAIPLAACTPGPPPLSDPREILAAAVAHLETARTVHIDASVSGTLRVGSVLGPGPSAAWGALAMEGTHLQGDLDLDGRRADITFRVPALLGLEGEIRQVGSDAFLESSLTSKGWHRLTGDALPFAIDRPVEWSDALVSLLVGQASFPTRLDDRSCASGSCYVLRVEPSGAVAALASTAPELSAALAGATVALELRIDRTSLVVTEARFDIDLLARGSIALSIAFSAWDAAVTIQAPPESEIVAGPLLP